MKVKQMLMFSAVALLVMGCATAPNERPKQVRSGLGQLGVTASGVPVMSGNFAAIPPGQPGDGGAPGSAAAAGK